MGLALRVHQGISHLEWGECAAIQESLVLAQVLNSAHVNLESDVEANIKSCVGSKTLPTDVEGIVQDCLALKSSFLSCYFMYINRLNNTATHDCAKKVFSLGVSKMWISNLPNGILSDF